MKERTIWYEYFELTDLPIGDLPYATIQRALKDEKYLRKFTPTFCRNDLAQGHFSALLYWFPHYVEQLYALAIDGHNYMFYFKTLSPEIIEGFTYLFPELMKNLDKARDLTLKSNELDEIKIKRKKPNYKLEEK